MWIIQKIWNNPFTVGLQRSFANFFLEKKNNNHSIIGYMSVVKNTKLGEYTTIKNESMLLNSEVGDYTYISHASNITFTKIWKFCSIGQNFKAWLWKHPTDFVSSHPIFYSLWKQCQITFADKNYFQEREQIIIGNDVRIGTNVIVMDGITIWDGAIIAASSVVTKDVEPYSIVGWVPAKIIKYRFEPEQINYLLKFKWWDKDIHWIRKNYMLFHNIEKFMKANHIG